MRIGFEPGDGSFEITLENGEKLPSDWNIPGVHVMREVGPMCGGAIYRTIKTEHQILSPEELNATS